MHDVEYGNIPQHFKYTNKKQSSKHVYNTRQKDDYVVPRLDSNLSRKTSCMYNGIKFWNQLSQETRSIKNKNTFKHSIKNDILNRY